MPRAQGRTTRPTTRAGRRTDAEDEAPTIGVDVGGTKIEMSVVRADGRISTRYRFPTRAERPPAAVVADLATGIRHHLGVAARRATAVGVGFAGQVDRDGTILGAPNLHWRKYALAQAIERAVRLPVVVTNDVRAATYGEWRFGAGRGAEDIVCVFVGTGVGGGIVADGRLRLGASSTAGEVGHMTVQHDGRQCHCKNRGCLEAYVGGWAIAERAQEAARQAPGRAARLRALAGSETGITAETVRDASRAHDPLATEILKETIGYLADGMINVVNGFNPQVLILGGGVIEGIPSMIAPVRAHVRRFALPAAVRRLRIVRAGLGGDAGAIGAAALARASGGSTP